MSIRNYLDDDGRVINTECVCFSCFFEGRQQFTFNTDSVVVLCQLLNLMFLYLIIHFGWVFRDETSDTSR